LYDIVITWSIILLVIFLIHITTIEDHRLKKILYVALSIRLLLMVIEVYIYSDLPYLTARDAGRFQRRAVAFYDQYSLYELLMPPYPSGSGLYSYMMATIYAFFGTTENSIIRSVNILAGVFVVYNSYKISQTLWTRNVAVQNALILAIFPLLAVYAQDAIRESFVVYFLTLGILYYVYWSHQKRPYYLIISVFGFALSTALHMGALMALLALLVYYFWRAINSLFTGKVYSLINTIVVIGIVGAGIFYLNTTGWGLGDIGGEGAIGEFGMEELIERRGHGETRGRAGYLEGMLANNPLDIIWQTPVRVAYFLFTPFPWMMNSLWDLVGLFDSLLYLLVFWGIYKSLPVLRQDPEKMALLFMLIGMLIIFAWGVSNYGTAMRHRAKIIPLAICLAPHIYPLRRVVYNQLKKKWQIIYLLKLLRN